MEFEVEIEDDSSSTPIWDSGTTRLLIATRLKYEEAFKAGRIRKPLIWNKILKDLLEINSDFKITVDEITKKFYNLMVTYKRIKRRSYRSGRIKTSWEYFDLFDKVYGKDFAEVSADPLDFPQTEIINNDSVDDWNSNVHSEDDNYDDDDNSSRANESSYQVKKKHQNGNEKKSNKYVIETTSHHNTRSSRSNQQRASIADSPAPAATVPSVATISGGSSSKLKTPKKKSRLKHELLELFKNQEIGVERRHRQRLKVDLKKIKIEEDKLRIMTEIRDLLRETRY